MASFGYQNPTRIIFGKEKEKMIGSVLEEFNIKKVLLLFGKESIKKSGLYDRVIESLNAKDVVAIPFGGVKSNPVLEHAEEAIKVAKAEKVEAILAVGGGSVSDEAKVISSGALVDFSPWDFYLHKQEVKAALPVFTIMTIAATASEANGGAVLSNDQTKQKLPYISPLWFPKVSILNPELTCTVPKTYSAYSGVDAMAHVLELYLTISSGLEMTQRLCEAICINIIDSMEKILKKPTDYDGRADFMWSATLALNGLTGCGMSDGAFPNHMIEHAVSAVHDIPHGAGLSIIFPAWMRYCLKHDMHRDRFELFAKKVFHKETAEEGIIALEQWFQHLDSPIRLSFYKIGRDTLPDIKREAIRGFDLFLPDYPHSEEMIDEILELALE
eukprot:TRINITY_DN81705_c0_g1_i1.p1 TRINITY_DN81705_c0_g1~~TRINITY_DN81705_c0_g1_i1.p1  ORF type:complete len:386 (-),score=115.50 TRINITY_DN81705_c0_g1_i1:109-1266(-)